MRVSSASAGEGTGSANPHPPHFGRGYHEKAKKIVTGIKDAEASVTPERSPVCRGGQSSRVHPRFVSNLIIQSPTQIFSATTKTKKLHSCYFWCSECQQLTETICNHRTTDQQLGSTAYGNRTADSAPGTTSIDNERERTVNRVSAQPPEPTYRDGGSVKTTAGKDCFLPTSASVGCVRVSSSAQLLPSRFYMDSIRRALTKHAQGRGDSQSSDTKRRPCIRQPRPLQPKRREHEPLKRSAHVSRPGRGHGRGRQGGTSGA